MNSLSYELSPEAHEEVFDILKADTFADTEAAESPVLIIVGGYHASQSMELRAAATQKMSPSPVVVSAAEARHFHPSADELLTTKEKLFVQATETDAEKWAERLVLEAVEERRNIVLDGFLTGGLRTVDLIKQARDADYDVEVQVVVVPAQIAKTQIVDLYEAEKECAGWGMWMPASVHDRAMMSVAGNLHMIEKRDLAPIKVLDRKGTLLLSTEESRDAAEASQREMKRPLDQFEIEWLQACKRRVEEKMTARQASARDRVEAEHMLNSGRSRGMER